MTEKRQLDLLGGAEPAANKVASEPVPTAAAAATFSELEEGRDRHDELVGDDGLAELVLELEPDARLFAGDDVLGDGRLHEHLAIIGDELLRAVVGREGLRIGRTGMLAHLHHREASAGETGDGDKAREQIATEA